MHPAPLAIQPRTPHAMSRATAPDVGEQARPLELVDLDGARVRLEDLRGRASLLIFLRHAG
jgi:cytochrome oxidase Cu insertion factor (SCO1/SenC/PrrC family)